MKKFLEALEKNIQEFTPVIFLISIALEAYLIIRIFYDLPRNAADVIYWVLVGTVIMGADAFIVLEIKKCFTCKKWGQFVGFCFGYLIILFILFFAALGYNLKAISGKSEYRSQNSKIIQDIQDETESDRQAKVKYSMLLSSATNERDIYKYRNLIAEQQTNINKLDDKLEKLGSTNSDNNSDAFTLIADKIKWNKNNLIFSFLSAIWGVLVMVTLLTAPVIGEIAIIKKNEGIQGNELSDAEWIRENADSVMKFIDTMYRNPGKSLLIKSPERIAEESGIPFDEIIKIRKKLAYHLSINQGKERIPLIKSSEGKSEASFDYTTLRTSMESFISV